jgi:dienelactone hydrolase
MADTRGSGIPAARWRNRRAAEKGRRSLCLEQGNAIFRGVNSTDASTAPNSRPAVLLVPGWDDGREQYRGLAREFARRGWICRMVDVPNPSWTAAERQAVTREDNLQDLLHAYDAFAREAAVPPDAITLVGVSYGGYLAAFASAMRPVRRLVLRAPALYRDEGWTLPKEQLDKEDLSVYRLLKLRPQDNRALAACAAFRGEVLIVESGHDDTVPHPVIENYLSAFEQARSVEAEVLEGADHALSHPDWQRDFHLRLLAWLERQDAAPAQRP